MEQGHGCGGMGGSTLDSLDIAMLSFFFWVLDQFVESTTQKLLLVASAAFAVQGSRLSQRRVGLSSLFD